MPADRSRDVLEFWFGAGDEASSLAARDDWFRKDDAFDAAIRTGFGALIAEALAGGLGDWCASPRGALARVIVLDQFTRNAFRGTPQAFAGDARALATARDAIARGYDAALAPRERHFLYMPFEHSEAMADQERSVALFEALARDTGLDDPLDWAIRHADVIRRFGRFPHRNAILGRPSTPAELEYLAQPGSGF
jgi:uncharacterized protein (DUF924 family)